MPEKEDAYNVIKLDNIDSTNNYLKNLNVDNSLEEGTVILAEYQNAGKGQGKNSWHSKKGKNLLLSILFKPSINATEHFMISEFISLGIIDTLASFGITSEIKWPNDIFVGNKKIAGILVENSIMDKLIFQTIGGIGLNLNEDDFPEDLLNPTSIKLLTNKEVNIEDLLKFLIKNLFNRYELVKEKNIQKLNDEYNSLLYKRNIQAVYQSDDLSFKATLLGVSKSGELRLKMEDDSVKEYLFGEVHMIL
jgi:BirA family biotin operon repressor/biotin-[acetyl-CoA-carboxylase] ligase